MAAGFKWWDLLHNEYLTHNTHVSAAAVGAGVLLAGGIAYLAKAPKVALANAKDEDFVPSEKFGIRNVWEVCGEMVQGIARDIIGPHYAKYLPLLLFVFVWTLLNNFLGSVPGLASATDNLNTSLGMGLCVFIYYNVMGFKEHGFKYLEQFTGHLGGVLLLFLGPVMFVIETISHMIRPVTLGIRLRTNIYADHQVHYTIVGMLKEVSASLTESLGAFGSFLGFIISSIGPIPILALGLLVVVIQAFVFTLLTMIYIGLATAHEEH
ncbi:F0F1 ATP synthase subunit A [bacterium]|nr:F0F1 ATP synthase subunit A [bacterium]